MGGEGLWGQWRMAAFPFRLKVIEAWRAPMDQNSPKPAETLSAKDYALQICRRWLEEQGGNGRIPQVLEILAEQTAHTIARGFAAPALDAESLQRLYLDRHGGRAPDLPPSRWLLSSRVEKWWDFRRLSLAQALRRDGSTQSVDLVRIPGGGRGNLTQFRLDFRALVEEGENASTEVSADLPTLDAAAHVVYQAEPARAAWWLRLLVGSQPFRMRSWRGYLLIGMTLAEALILFGVWVFVWWMMNRPRPIYVQDLCMVAMLAFVTLSWWRWMQPLVRLPEQRVTIAGDLFLAASQFHGQLRLVRDAQSKLVGGWFQLVRHWAICPVCGGEVEIADGRPEFAGRLVGRCSDSPLEHVFSFDPTSMAGTLLHD